MQHILRVETVVAQFIIYYLVGREVTAYIGILPYQIIGCEQQYSL